MPRALSCRTTGARLLRCISGTVEERSPRKPSSGREGRRKGERGRWENEGRRGRREKEGWEGEGEVRNGGGGRKSSLGPGPTNKMGAWYNYLITCIT